MVKQDNIEPMIVIFKLRFKPKSTLIVVKHGGGRIMLSFFSANRANALCKVSVIFKKNRVYLERERYHQINFTSKEQMVEIKI